MPRLYSLDGGLVKSIMVSNHNNRHNLKNEVVFEMLCRVIFVLLHMPMLHITKYLVGSPRYDEY